MPFVLRASAKACGEGMVQVRSWQLLGEHAGPAFYRLGAGQGLLYGASGTPSYSGERSAAAIRIPNVRHALATSGHKPEKEFYTRRQYVVYEDQLQYEVATFRSTHEKKDYSNMKEQYTSKTGNAK